MAEIKDPIEEVFKTHSLPEVSAYITKQARTLERDISQAETEVDRTKALLNAKQLCILVRKLNAIINPEGA